MKEFKILDKPVKVIFLDIDGVLNTGNNLHYSWIMDNKKHSYNYAHRWDIRCMWLLKKLLDDNKDVYIVISSTWRIFYPDMNVTNKDWGALMENFEMIDKTDRIIGITPRLQSRQREDEIKHYLKHTKNNIKNFCVIDDDIADLTAFKDKELVKCDYEFGFTSRKYEEALKILNEEE